MIAPGIDIPPGLEESYHKIVSFLGGNNPDTIIVNNGSPAKKNFSRVAQRSLFVKWQSLYNGFISSRKIAWTDYWISLPFGDHGGANGWPGSGFSAFIYINAPRYELGLDLLLDPPSLYNLDASCFTTTILYPFGSASTTQKHGMSFVPTATAQVTKISLLMQKTGSPTDDLSLTICSDNSNEPGTELFVSDNVFNGSTLSTSVDSQLDFLFSDPTALVSGTKYWFVLKRSTAVNASNYYRAWVSISSSPSWQKLLSAFISGNWYFNGNYYQFYFQEYHSYVI